MSCDALFNTRCFLFAFLPVVLAGYWLLPWRRGKLLWVTLASFTFYSFWDVRFSVLLLAAAVVDYLLALRVAAAQERRPKRAWLACSIVFNLGVLAFFKYAMFAAAGARSLFHLLGSSVEIPYFSIVLPVGISFFTFKTMSYVIDVYRGEVQATRDFPKYLAFVSLFPELVAGPIVRYRSLGDQLDAIPRRPQAAFFGVGAQFFILGLAKKVLVADTLAAHVDPYWAQPEGLTMLQGWTAALGYTLQLYFDFSGYSDMALGLGAMLGLRFPINFRAPYQALNPTDFWRRWHISLSTWLRDYLYIPLGGSRKGEVRARVNIVVVMALGGLWHGAAWTFVLWGLYHAGLLVLYRSVHGSWDRLPRPVQRGLTFLLVVVGWVIFRSGSLATAGSVYRAMAGVGTLGLAEVATLTAALVGLGVLFVLLARPTVEMSLRSTRWRGAALGAIFALSIVWMSRESPFLYYQF
ncbi:MAG TPA: MBOAT family protein [Candidatus Thermoplasmatota archaeon]|nr:MBOAT family protein [Candidatus Thermoplasmatota archaeon]